MADISVTRWTRYGKDRAYANGPGRKQLGHLDLLTGEIVVNQGADVETVTQALREWQAAHLPGQSLTAESTPAPQASPVLPSERLTPLATAPSTDPHGKESLADDDLARHRPGELARLRAEAEWAANKEDSKFWAYTARLFNVRTEERAWRVGAEGEATVGTRLEKLAKDGARILHSVPVGKRGSDIDHVVISSGGVFTVNSKRHPGAKVWVSERQIRINGQVVPYLRNSRYEAERTAKLLSAAIGWDVPVRAIIAIVDDRMMLEITRRGRDPQGVYVDGVGGAIRHIKRARPLLRSDHIEMIYEVARRRSTWT